MKRIIVKPSQVKYLREDTITPQFAAPNNDASACLSQGDTQSQIRKVQATFGGNVTAQITPEDGPGEGTITLPNTKGGVNGAQEAIKDNNEEASKALSNGMNVGVDVSESKVYTKRIVENVRLAKMRENGMIMTKRQLNEEFFNLDLYAQKVHNFADKLVTIIYAKNKDGEVYFEEDKPFVNIFGQTIALDDFYISKYGDNVVLNYNEGQSYSCDLYYNERDSEFDTEKEFNEFLMNVDMLNTLRVIYKFITK